MSARLQFSGHARASGIAISDIVFQLYWAEGGLIVRIEDFATGAEALKAVRLEQ